MIYTCTAFFYMNEEEKYCYVEIPQLGIDYEVRPEEFTQENIIKTAYKGYEDMLFALSLEKDEIEIAGLADASSAYDFREEFTADLDEVKKSRKVIWRMKYDDQPE